MFIHSKSAGYITHVGFLEKPVDPAKPNGDWYVIEARGVMYGVVRTKLNGRGWNRWGLMTKYFEYGDSDTVPSSTVNDSPRTLKKGMSGSDVKIMQEALIGAGYDLGKWGADGDFGSDTEKAVKQFQKDKGLAVSGQCDAATWAAIDKLTVDDPEAMADEDEDTDTSMDGDALDPAEDGEPEKDTNYYVRVTGGAVNVRSQPNTNGKIVCVAQKGDLLAYAGNTSTDGWHNVVCEGQSAWISGKYAEVKAIDGEEAPGTTVVDDGRAIIDISAYQTIKDAAAAAKIAKTVKLVIHRASVGSNKDTKWAKHAKLMRDAGIAYGVYHYVKAKTAAAAKEEAQLFWKQASPYSPLFYVADMEYSGIPKGKARAVCSAFIAELKRLGARKTGIYVGHHLYKLWDLNYGEVDFVWIPRYGDKKTNLAGKPGKWPAYPCTLHQYTSCGSVPGVTGRVDMNRLTGKGLTFLQ